MGKSKLKYKVYDGVEKMFKTLKEKGFKEKCLCHYIGDDLFYNIESPIANNQLWNCHNQYDNAWNRDNYDAPTISQVLKWLRENKQIHVGIIFTGRDYTTWIQPLNNIDTQITIHDCDNNNEASIAGIEYVLDNLIEL